MGMSGAGAPVRREPPAHEVADGRFVHEAFEASPNAIEVRQVSKSFRGGVEALVDVSLTVRPGEIFGLVGRNGYGKTTLIKCICSLVEPTRGSVRVLGLDAVRSGRTTRRQLGYVSAEDRTFYFRLTGRQNLLFFAQLQGVRAGDAHRRIDELAERFGIGELLGRRFQEYSTGNRQRLSLVRALLHDPRVLILDEPTRSLDPFAAANLRRALAEWVAANRRRSVLITSHNLDEVEQLGHRVGIMSRGHLREQGTLSELRQRHGNHERVRLWLDRAIDRGYLQTVPGVAQVLVEGRDPARGPYVEFHRAPGDAMLERVVRVVLAAGSTLRSFDRQELSLQDLIDRVDGSTAWGT